MSKTYDVIGIGNAIVDVLNKCSDDFLHNNNIQKGVMQLIDTKRAADLYSKMNDGVEISGGSAANTLSSIAQLGLKTGFIAKVKNDPLGHVFAQDIRAQGITFETPMLASDYPDETARCLVFVTPDGERSMNTYLGVSNLLNTSDIDQNFLTDTKWLYLEGYLFDSPDNQAAFMAAIQKVKSAGGKVALSLSDPFCVERHKDAFAHLIKHHIDLLFCNEHEGQAMFGGSLKQAVNTGGKWVDLCVCTAGAQGVYIANNAEITHVVAQPITPIDATGAGDGFAAGFLTGLIQGKTIDCCGKMGCAIAGNVISHMGARPKSDIRNLLKTIC